MFQISNFYLSNSSMFINLNSFSHKVDLWKQNRCGDAKRAGFFLRNVNAGYLNLGMGRI